MSTKLPMQHDVDSHEFNDTLDGVSYKIRLTYKDRTCSWYLDVWDENGDAVLRGRRLSPEFSPNGGVTALGPPGIFFAVGQDPYDRYEVSLWYMPKDEIDAFPSPTSSSTDIAITATSQAPAEPPEIGIPGGSGAPPGSILPAPVSSP